MLEKRFKQMDYPGAGSFSNDEGASLLHLPEIHDAIQRVIERSGSATVSLIDLGYPVPTDNPYVQRVYIMIVYEKGCVPLPHEFTIWVDDFELVFTLLDDTLYDQFNDE
jgi:hypothetical protein